MPAGPRSVAERAALGKELRKRVARSSHGGWEPAAGRPDPVAVLESQDESRVPELISIHRQRMLASAFAFFRGGAAIMAGDLAHTPRTGLEVQLCGDAHLSNFGVFQAPDRSLVFDVNDFDETLRGPFEWDVKRLAASLSVAGSELGFAEGERRSVVIGAVGAYRKAMREFAAMPDLDVWYARLNAARLRSWAGISVGPRRRRLERDLEKAKRKNSMRALARLTRLEDGEPRIVADRPLVVPVEELVAEGRDIEGVLETLLAAYREALTPDVRHLMAGYRYAHAARKVVGVGSVGTRAWIVLLLGRDAGDPLFLQAKEAQASVLEAHLDAGSHENNGRRVVEGQRLMQAASDILLGWLSAEGIDGVRRDFYVRQLWDGKGSAEIEAMTLAGLASYGRACGWTLARAHARTGDRVALASYLGSGTPFDRALADFAEAYAERNELDYRAFASPGGPESADATGANRLGSQLA